LNGFRLSENVDAQTMTVKFFVFNPFQENTYVLSDDTRDCVIIDPGCYEEHEKKTLTDYIAANDLTVRMLLNTHCHIDHILGNSFVKEKYNTKLYIHPTEEYVLNAQKIFAPNYGFHQYHEARPDVYLTPGEIIEFGAQKFSILFVPGHAPGHVAFYNEKEKIVIGGDVLFEGSIGRTDLPGGDFKTLIKSIHEQLFTLPDDVIVYPGHGDETTVGVEKRTNPFCRLT
jgi:glyoxylase-like metal-dependent hydrolase (beta-lactamase superfamily II)